MTHNPRTLTARLRTGLLLLVSTGCLNDSTAPSGTAPVVGSWQFSGQQTSGATTALSGTMVIVNASLTSYTGTLDITATTPGSGATRLAGPLSGRMVNSSSVDFAANFGGIQRQHIGTLVADTITGSWLETSGNGVGASGTFRAIRTAR